MPPKFADLPQTTQNPHSRRQSHNKPSASLRSTQSVSQSQQQWSTLRPYQEEVPHNEDEYQLSLKRKVTSDHSQSMSNTTFAQSFASLVPPQPNQTYVPSRTSTPSSREYMGVSRLSKMLAPAVQGASGIRHLSSGQRPSTHSTHPGEPVPHDTIPSQVSHYARNRKSSEHPKFVIPKNTMSPTQKSKKSEKFRPPLVNGGHAQRLWNLMQDQKSEYAVWLSTSSRPAAMFESTEPIAVVEIRNIFWDHRLQWTRCDIIDWRKDRAPFDSLASQEEEEYLICQEDEKHLDVTGQEDTAERYPHSNSEPVSSQLVISRTLYRDDSTQDDPCATQHTEPVSISDGSQDAERVTASPEADDSISGLHRCMDKMIVLESAHGSLFAGTPRITEKHMLREQRSLGPTQEDKQESHRPDLIKYLQSSQGSVDDEEEEECGRRLGALQPAVQSSSMNVDSDLTSHLGEPTRDNTASGSVDLYDSMEPNAISDRSNTCISSISEITSATSMSTTVGLIDSDIVVSDGSLVTPSPTRATSPVVDERLSETMKDEKDAHKQSVNLIFSNLFSWTNLKITDRVEIHGPCRKIVLSKSSGGYVLIAERYRVLTLQ